MLDLKEAMVHMTPTKMTYIPPRRIVKHTTGILFTETVKLFQVTNARSLSDETCADQEMIRGLPN